MRLLAFKVGFLAVAMALLLQFAAGVIGDHQGRQARLLDEIGREAGFR